MKSNLLIWVFVMTFFTSLGQVSISRGFAGKLKKVSKEEFDKFKTSKTVFILPKSLIDNSFTKSLEEIWDVTDFIIVSVKQFNYKDFLDKNYSFVEYSSFEITSNFGSQTYTNYYNHIKFTLFDFDEYEKDISKIGNVRKEKYLKKIKNFYHKNIISIGRINIDPLLFHINDSGTGYSDYARSYNSDYGVRRNSYERKRAGFLKNYFQKINSLIKSNQNFWMYKNDNTDELKNLITKTLFVPSYIEDNYEKGNFRKKISNNYDYKFEIIDTNQLNKKILDNKESFYYLMFTSANKEKFFQIINSRTGEIVYRDYVADALSSKGIKQRHIDNINKTIKKYH